MIAPQHARTSSQLISTLLIDEAYYTDRRLELLEAFDILDTPPEPEFEDIVHMAALVCKTLVSLVSLVAEDRQWFKARVGFEACETPIEQSVCRNALTSTDLLVIPDLTADPRTQQNTLVTSGPQIRFYAGAPLVTADGTIVGTLCVIDTVPRPNGLDETQKAVLGGLSRQVVTHLEARRISTRKDELFQRQKGLSATIRASANKALAAQEAGRDGTFEIDTRTGTAIVSAQMCRIFGVPVQREYPATKFEEFTLDEDKTLQSSAVTRADGSAPTNTVYRIKVPDRGVRWIARNAVFEYDEHGVPAKMLGTVQDITEERKAAIRLQAMLDVGDRMRDLDDIPSMLIVASDLMAKSLDAVRAGFGIVDPVAETVNIREEWRAPGISTIAGIHRFRDFGSYIDDLKNGDPVIILDVADDPRTAENVEPLLKLGIRGMVNLPIMDHGVLNLVVLVHHDRPYAWSDEELAFIRNFGDRVQIAIARIQAERDQDTLNREIGHRLKNTFAMVQAIAHQTLRGVTERELVSDFSKRLNALSTAHDMLLTGAHGGATVEQIVKGFSTTMSIEHRVDFSGPEVVLGSRGTLSLSLLLHELGTNAIKYGALSNEAGRVNVSWEIVGEADEATFRLMWAENGGPPATEPVRKGFGSKLIRMGLMGTGGVMTSFGSQGFSADMSANLTQLERAN